MWVSIPGVKQKPISLSVELILNWRTEVEPQEVLYHVRCQSGGQQAMKVAEGMRVVVEGHMEAPPTVLRTQDGKDLGFRLMARTVTSVK